MAILAEIVAALKALPAIESLVELFIDAWAKHDAEQAKKEAIELKATKDLEVDDAIDGPSRVRDPWTGSSQQPKIDGKS